MNAHLSPRSILTSKSCARDFCGFTLVELLVATSLLAIVASMAAVVMLVSNRAIVNTTTMSGSMAAIDDDISQIKLLAERYTCCSGTCTADTTAIATAVAAGKCAGNIGDSTYYFPQAGNTTEITNFATACTSGLTTNLVTAISAISQPSGVTRSVVDDGDATARRIRVTYSGTGINRIVKIVPSVSSWCS